jgi:hypothetical protein
MKHAATTVPHGGTHRRRARHPQSGGKAHGNPTRASGRMLGYAGMSMLCAAAALVIVLA